MLRRHQVPFFESLLWLDQGVNPGLRAIGEHSNHHPKNLLNTDPQTMEEIWNENIFQIVKKTFWQFPSKHTHLNAL